MEREEWEWKEREGRSEWRRERRGMEGESEGEREKNGDGRRE